MSMDEDIVDEAELRRQEIERATIIDASLHLVRTLRDENSPIYTLIQAAREDAIAANRQLILANPEDAQRIRRLQWQVTRFYDLQRYIGEVVEEGKSQMEGLSEEVREEWASMLGDGDQQQKDV